MPSFAKSLTAKPVALFAAAALLGAGFASGASAANLVDPRASGETQLRQLLRAHIFTGARVSREARAATGDPNITVIDRRTGGVSRCSFLNQQGKRVMICDS